MSHLLVYSFLLLAIASSYASVVAPTSYVVSVQSSGDSETLCGGALIDKGTVLTTAQCLAFNSPENFVVSVNEGAQTIQVKSYSFDPRFDFVTMEYNMGILFLAEPAKANVIECAQKQSQTGASGVVYSRAANSKLVSVDVELISTNDCASGKYVYSEDEVLNTMVCGLVKNNKSCVGGFGSPVVSGNKLVGLASWGGCGVNGKPAVFSDVPSQRSWIDSALQKLGQ